MTLLFFLIFFLLLINYLNFLLKIFNGLNRLSSVKIKEPIKEFASIIIPFRNESENILNNLKSIEEQDYPTEKYEVIYIDDSSEDNSHELLCKNKMKENIKVINVPSHNSLSAYKKRAINYGIENSKGEIIITSDADCIYSPKWLRTMLSSFEKETGFVSGPVGFISDDSFFQNLQSLEFSGLIISGAGLIGARQPVICNAANIAFRKKAFYDVNGFQGHLHLSSGDDEILMQKIFKKKSYKIEFCLNHEAVVKTDANKTLKQFYNQRKRWASKSLFYQDKKLIAQLIMIFLFYFGIIIQIFLAILLSDYFYISLTAGIAGKIIIEYLVVKRGAKMIFNQNNIKNFFAAEFLHIPYIIITSIAGLFGNYEWKERRVKR